MKCIKMLGLLAMTAAALMALAGGASATTITSPTGTDYTGAITAESEGFIKLDGAFVTIECDSHIGSKVQQHGAGVTASGEVLALSFTNCNYPTTIVKRGSLEIHAVNCDVNNECTGTLTSTGAEIAIHTSVGTCVFTTNATHIGSLTPTNETGGNATLDIVGANILRTGGSFLCGAAGTLTGSYKVTTPASLFIDP